MYVIGVLCLVCFGEIMQIQNKIKNLIAEYGIVDDSELNPKFLNFIEFQIVLLGKNKQLGFTLSDKWIEFLQVNNSFRYIQIPKERLPSNWAKGTTFWDSRYIHSIITGLDDYVVYFPNIFAPLFIRYDKFNEVLFMAIAPFDLKVPYDLQLAIPHNFDNEKENPNDYIKAINEIWLLILLRDDGVQENIGFYQHTENMLKMKSILENKKQRFKLERVPISASYITKERILG